MYVAQYSAAMLTLARSLLHCRQVECRFAVLQASDFEVLVFWHLSFEGQLGFGGLLCSDIFLFLAAQALRQRRRMLWPPKCL